MKLETVLNAVTATEQTLIPIIFASNPEDEAIASAAFVAEQTFFSLFKAFHSSTTTTAPAAAPSAPVATPAATSTTAAATVVPGFVPDGVPSAH